MIRQLDEAGGGETGGGPGGGGGGGGGGGAGGGGVGGGGLVGGGAGGGGAGGGGGEAGGGDTGGCAPSEPPPPQPAVAAHRVLAATSKAKLANLAETGAAPAISLAARLAESRASMGTTCGLPPARRHHGAGGIEAVKWCRPQPWRCHSFLCNAGREWMRPDWIKAAVHPRGHASKPPCERQHPAMNLKLSQPACRSVTLRSMVPVTDGQHHVVLAGAPTRQQGVGAGDLSCLHAGIDLARDAVIGERSQLPGVDP